MRGAKKWKTQKKIMINQSRTSNVAVSIIEVPENEYSIEEGYYIGNAIVKLLRDNKDKPDVIQFIADMLEE